MYTREEILALPARDNPRILQAEDTDEVFIIPANKTGLQGLRVNFSVIYLIAEILEDPGPLREALGLNADPLKTRIYNETTASYYTLKLTGEVGDEIISYDPEP